MKLPLHAIAATCGILLYSAVRGQPLPSLDEALASRQDVWALAAMRQANGASYEFFKDLLPPLRYVNAAFRYYPIILSAPNSRQKVRLVSNGSALNPRPQLQTWKDEGTPVTFAIGGNATPFGSDLRKVNGPRYADGWLPIVQIECEDGGIHYTEETFASVEPALAEHGVAFVQFKTDGAGKITAHIDSPGALAWFDKAWKWDVAGQTLTATFASGGTAALAISATPLPKNAVATYDYVKQKKKCAAVWKKFLSTGMQLNSPESVVNNAWRSLLAGNEIMVEGDEPEYGWGTLYERTYEAESGDVVGAFLLWGSADARRMMPSLLDYNRDNFPFHNTGFKLQLLSQYYWLTRDAAFVVSIRDKWEKLVATIVEGREKTSGLAPRESYCGDISTPVYSLNANASAWAGLHRFSAVLEDMGEHAEAARLAAIAAEYQNKIIDAVDKSVRRDVSPPFVPIALFGAEQPVSPSTSTKLGSYWNLMAPYVLGSGLFAHGSEYEQAMLHGLQENGGLCMGMIRFDQHSGLFANENGVDDLYGLRYDNLLLRLDDPERALADFYGKLAQGMTQDTFIGGEGTSLRPLDDFGRPMYLPPNSSANAHFLWTLRYMLVQDWDSGGNAMPDTLRLLFATPKRWLEDGKTIDIERAPTAFGEVSVKVKSHLKSGYVLAEIQPPQRQQPREILLRARVPDGWVTDAAEVVRGPRKVNGIPLKVDDRGTVTLPLLRGKFVVRFHVKPESKMQ